MLYLLLILYVLTKVCHVLVVQSRVDLVHEVKGEFPDLLTGEYERKRC